MTLDIDLEKMDRDALLMEVKKLRSGIRKHRDSSGHDLCWFHPELWDLLPEAMDVRPTVPPWPEFMSRCAKYRASLDTETVDPSGCNCRARLLAAAKSFEEYAQSMHPEMQQAARVRASYMKDAAELLSSPQSPRGP